MVNKNMHSSSPRKPYIMPCWTLKFQNPEEEFEFTRFEYTTWRKLWIGVCIIAFTSLWVSAISYYTLVGSDIYILGLFLSISCVCIIVTSVHMYLSRLSDTLGGVYHFFHLTCMSSIIICVKVLTPVISELNVTEFCIILIVSVSFFRLRGECVLCLTLVGITSGIVQQVLYSIHPVNILLLASLHTMFGAIGVIWAKKLELTVRNQFQNQKHVTRNNQTLETFLTTILPPIHIPMIISGDSKSIMDVNEHVSVVFAAISGVDDLLRFGESAADVALKFDTCIKQLDDLTEKRDMYKVSSTMEYTYFAVAGLPLPFVGRNSNDAAVDLAFDFISYFSKYDNFTVKCGVAHGAAVGGIIGGLKRPYYQVVGDLINVSSRLASTGLIGTCQCLADFVNHITIPIRIQENGLVKLKGKGYCSTVFLTPTIMTRRKSVAGIPSPNPNFISTPPLPELALDDSIPDQQILTREHKKLRKYQSELHIRTGLSVQSSPSTEFPLIDVKQPESPRPSLQPQQPWFIRNVIGRSDSTDSMQSESQFQYSKSSFVEHRASAGWKSDSLTDLASHIKGSEGNQLTLSLTFEEDVLEQDYQNISMRMQLGIPRRIIFIVLLVQYILFLTCAAMDNVYQTNRALSEIDNPMVIAILYLIAVHLVLNGLCTLTSSSFFNRHRRIILSATSIGVVISPQLLLLTTRWAIGRSAILFVLGIFIPIIGVSYSLVMWIIPLSTLCTVLMSVLAFRGLTWTLGTIFIVSVVAVLGIAASYLNERVHRLAFLEYIRQLTSAKICQALVDDLFPPQAVRMLNMGCIKAIVGVERCWKMLKRSDSSSRDSWSDSEDTESDNMKTFNQVAVVVIDIVDFTGHSSTINKRTLFKFVNTVMTGIDNVTNNNSMFKVDIIGDSYVAISNVFSKVFDPSEISDNAVNFALATIETVRDMKWPDSEDNVRIRVGVHVGSVTLGFFGKIRPRLAPIGLAVDTAIMLERTGIAGAVHISAPVKSGLCKNKHMVVDHHPKLSTGSSKNKYFVFPPRKEALARRMSFSQGSSPPYTPLKRRSSFTLSSSPSPRNRRNSLSLQTVHTAPTTSPRPRHRLPALNAVNTRRHSVMVPGLVDKFVLSRLAE